MDLRRIAWIYTGLQTRLRLISSCVTSPRPPFHSSLLPLSLHLFIFPSYAVCLLSSPRGLRPIPAKISGPGRVVDWKSAIPVAATFIDVNLLSDVADLNDRFEVKACFGTERVFFLIFRDDFD